MNTRSVSVRLDPDLREDAEHISRETGTSLSDALRLAVRVGLAELKRRPSCELVPTLPAPPPEAA